MIALITSILSLLGGIISIYIYRWQQEAERKKLSDAEIVRGEAAEKAAEASAKISGSEINQSIDGQTDIREKADF